MVYSHVHNPSFESCPRFLIDRYFEKQKFEYRTAPLGYEKVMHHIKIRHFKFNEFLNTFKYGFITSIYKLNHVHIEINEDFLFFNFLKIVCSQGHFSNLSFKKKKKRESNTYTILVLTLIHTKPFLICTLYAHSQVLQVSHNQEIVNKYQFFQISMEKSGFMSNQKICHGFSLSMQSPI